METLRCLAEAVDSLAEDTAEIIIGIDDKIVSAIRKIRQHKEKKL